MDRRFPRHSALPETTRALTVAPERPPRVWVREFTPRISNPFEQLHNVVRLDAPLMRRVATCSSFVGTVLHPPTPLTFEGAGVSSCGAHRYSRQRVSGRGGEKHCFSAPFCGVL